MIPSPDRPVTGDSPLNSQHEAVAADWLARREMGFSVEEQAEFSHWLLADPQHVAAVQRIDSTWRFLRKPHFAGQADAVEKAIVARVTVRTRNRQSWLTGLSLGGLAAAAAMAFFLRPDGVYQQVAPPVTLPTSVAAKPERQTLPDGSVVEFNAGAEIAVAFTPERRVVRLLRGEAHFSVAKNAARPFLVTAGEVTVRAVGTAFAVRYAPEQVGVLVTEGRVAVDREVSFAASDVARAEPSYFGAGFQLTVPIGNSPVAARPMPTAILESEMKASLAWRTQRVEFTDTPLSEVVEMFNRQNRVQLALGEAGLAEIRISGVFWVNAPEGFSRLIEASAGLRAEHLSDTRIVLRH